MTDLERIELAARRTASSGHASGTEIEIRIADMFERFANELAEQIKSKRDANKVDYLLE